MVIFNHAQTLLVFKLPPCCILFSNKILLQQKISLEKLFHEHTSGNTILIEFSLKTNSANIHLELAVWM